jgi:hypothetical protein
MQHPETSQAVWLKILYLIDESSEIKGITCSIIFWGHSKFGSVSTYNTRTSTIAMESQDVVSFYSGEWKNY